MRHAEEAFPHRYGSPPSGQRSTWMWVLAGGAVLVGAGLAGLAACPAARRTARHAVGWLPRTGSVDVSASATIDKPRGEIFRFWRDVTNLSRLLPRVEEITPLSERTYRWRVREPGGQLLEWESEITYEREGERIAWHTRPGADVPHAGRVTLHDAPGGRGTEVRVEMRYDAPGGPIGRGLAMLLGREPGQELREALQRLKQIMEGGSPAAGTAQSSGGA